MPEGDETFLLKNPLVSGRRIRRLFRRFERELNAIGWDILSKETPSYIDGDDELCWDNVIVEFTEVYMNILKFFYCLPAEHDYHGNLMTVAKELMIQDYWDVQYECGGISLNAVNHVGNGTIDVFVDQILEELVEYASNVFKQSDSPIDKDQLGYDPGGYLGVHLPLNPYIWHNFDDDCFVVVIERQWERLSLMYDVRDDWLLEDLTGSLEKYGRLAVYDQDVPDENCWYNNNFHEESKKHCGDPLLVRDFYFKVIDHLTTPDSIMHYTNIIGAHRDRPYCDCGHEGDRCIFSVLKFVSHELLQMPAMV